MDDQPDTTDRLDTTDSQSFSYQEMTICKYCGQESLQWVDTDVRGVSLKTCTLCCTTTVTGP